MRIANKLFLLLAIIVINNCASVSTPQGGAIDAIPPELVSTTPKILTEINPTQKITIQFNEYLQEASLKKAIKISEDALEEVLKNVKEGITESELAQMLIVEQYNR